MCGRYTLTAEGSMVADRFDIREGVPELVPRYNISPSQDVLTVVAREGENRAKTMRWGLVPFWARDTKIGYRMINARAETLPERNAFKHAFQRRRCLIPADSFYEWQGTGKSKQPFRVVLKSGEPFAFAGIWETWKPTEGPDSDWLLSCSIITTVANPLVESIHDRMPVILPPESYEAWLDPDNQDTGGLRELLLPFDPGAMKVYKVSTLVNSPKNTGPEVIQPVEG